MVTGVVSQKQNKARQRPDNGIKSYAVRKFQDEMEDKQNFTSIIYNIISCLKVGIEFSVSLETKARYSLQNFRRNLLREFYTA